MIQTRGHTLKITYLGNRVEGLKHNAGCGNCRVAVPGRYSNSNHFGVLGWLSIMGEVRASFCPVCCGSGLKKRTFSSVCYIFSNQSIIFKLELFYAFLSPMLLMG